MWSFANGLVVPMPTLPLTATKRFDEIGYSIPSVGVVELSTHELGFAWSLIEVAQPLGKDTIGVTPPMLGAGPSGRIPPDVRPEPRRCERAWSSVCLPSPLGGASPTPGRAAD